MKLAAIPLAAALVAGCSQGASPTLPLNAHASARGSMQPQAKQTDLLYLSDVESNDVAVYSYPKGRLVGTLTGFAQPRAECADSQGNVWISDAGTASISEFAHGATTPTKALSTPAAPGGCSVSPRNGDLAVAGGLNGTVVGVFRHSKHNRWRDASLYSVATMSNGYFCAYDSQGNLFVDGVDGSGKFALAELPHKGTALQSVTVNQTIQKPGGMVWDGSYITVGDAGVSPSVVYQLSVSGSTANPVGTTTLSGTTSVRQFWVDGARLIGPDYDAPVGFWNYPAGGSPVKTLSKTHGYGAAISAAYATAPPR
ncbi:MAG TPA: hypothetical protein VHR97_12060 [Candidatus Baltobacteraceae bacterium]|nr:hypothetical protein [Candidatus Baltobacteraceae bacterium]